MSLSLIDLFAEAVLRWSLRCDRPASDLTTLVMMAVYGGHPEGRTLSRPWPDDDVEPMRLALHELTVEPGLREDFLVRGLIRELDTILDDRLHNFGRNKARARLRARDLEAVLANPHRRERYLDESGLAERQAETILMELRRLAETADGIEELARRKRALDAWRDLSEPVLEPDLLREWREAQLF